MKKAILEAAQKKGYQSDITGAEVTIHTVTLQSGNQYEFRISLKNNRSLEILPRYRNRDEEITFFSAEMKKELPNIIRLYDEAAQSLGVQFLLFQKQWFRLLSSAEKADVFPKTDFFLVEGHHAIQLCETGVIDHRAPAYYKNYGEAETGLPAKVKAIYTFGNWIKKLSSKEPCVHFEQTDSSLEKPFSLFGYKGNVKLVMYDRIFVVEEGINFVSPIEKLNEEAAKLFLSKADEKMQVKHLFKPPMANFELWNERNDNGIPQAAAKWLYETYDWKTLERDFYQYSVDFEERRYTSLRIVRIREGYFVFKYRGRACYIGRDKEKALEVFKEEAEKLFQSAMDNLRI